jgi:hypothetical protein
MLRYGPYEWYLTLIFEDEIHPEQAHRRYMRFVRAVNEGIFGKRYRERDLGIYHVRVTEKQKRGVIHYYSLMGGGVGQLNPSIYSDIWHDDNGFAKIQPYNPGKGTVVYMTKYVGKGGEIELFIPPWKKAQSLDNGSLRHLTKE